MQAGIAATHVVDYRSEVDTQPGWQSAVIRAMPNVRVDRSVRAVQNQNLIVIEIGVQPASNIAARPIGIEGTANVSNRGVGGCDAFNLPQHSFAVICQRPREQLLLVLDRHDVGALSRSDDRDDDANDGDGDKHADGHDHAHPSAIPDRVLPRVGDARPGDGRHRRCPLKHPAR